ncbi:E3 ubiquitin-protein ligase rififylin-like isoform X2 [Mytilus edulis]
MTNHNLNSTDPLLKAQSQKIIIDAVRAKTNTDDDDTTTENQQEENSNRATLTFCDVCSQGVERGVRHVCPDVEQSPDDESSSNKEDSTECKICMDSESDCLVSPCNHLAMCMDCAKMLDNCPICRKDICKRLKIFRC